MNDIRINGIAIRTNYKSIVSMSALINKTKWVSFTTNKYRRVIRAIAPQIGEILLAPYEKTVIIPTNTEKRLKTKKFKRNAIRETTYPTTTSRMEKV